MQISGHTELQNVEFSAVSHNSSTDAFKIKGA